MPLHGAFLLFLDIFKSIILLFVVVLEHKVPLSGNFENKSFAVN